MGWKNGEAVLKSGQQELPRTVIPYGIRRRTNPKASVFTGAGENSAHLICRCRGPPGDA